MTDPTNSQPPSANTGISDSVDLAALLLWLLLGKRKIILTGIVFAIIAAAISLTMKKVYTADTEILPPQGSMTQSLMNQMGGAITMGSLGGMASALEAKMVAETYVAMLAARPVQDDLINQFHLKSVYKTPYMDKARIILESKSQIAATKENFITISVTDTDRQRAMNMANAYVGALRNLMHGLALSQASQNRIFYGEQLDKSKNDLAKAEVAFKQMQQSNHIISVGAQSESLIESAARLRAEIAAKDVQLQGLRSYSTEANPQVQLVEKELAAMRAQQAQMDANSQGSYSDVGLSSVPEAQLNFVRATRELKYQQDLYSMLVKQYEISEIQSAEQAPLIQVIEPAVLPEHKSGPRRSLITLGALLAGLVFGTIWALYDGWRKSLNATQEATFIQLRNAAFGRSKR